MSDSKNTLSELKKSFNLWKGLALAVSIVIGSGLLGLPGMTLEIGSVHASAGGWLLIIVAMVPLIYIFTQLGLRFTSSSGLSRYAEAAVGPWGSHAVSTVLCGTFTIGIPGIAFIGGAYAQKLFGMPHESVFWLAIAILIVAGLSNLFGVRIVNFINIASLTALFAMLCVIIFSNLPFFFRGLTVFGETLGGRGSIHLNDLWRIAALLFWAFMGWENLSFGLEEFKDPQKTIPKVYWLSFVVVVLLYLGLTITSIGAQVSGVSVKGPSGLTSLITRTPVGFLQTLIMVLVIPANASAWLFGASRLFYAAGRDGILPGIFGRLTKKGIPLNGLVVSLGVYILVVVAASFMKVPVSVLVLLVSQNFLVLYAFSIFAYWKTESKGRRWPITFLAILSCGFLLSGFNWWIIYPALLLMIGYLRFRHSNKALKKEFQYENQSCE